jgi:hypothetical protein
VKNTEIRRYAFLSRQLVDRMRFLKVAGISEAKKRYGLLVL